MRREIDKFKVWNDSMKFWVKNSDAMFLSANGEFIIEIYDGKFLSRDYNCFKICKNTGKQDYKSNNLYENDVIEYRLGQCTPNGGIISRGIIYWADSYAGFGIKDISGEGFGLDEFGDGLQLEVKKIGSILEEPSLINIELAY